MLLGFLALLRDGSCTVDSFVFESAWVGADIMYALQTEFEYTIYRLNVHDDRRYFNDTGHDVISHFQDIKVDDVIETFEMREKPRKA